MSHRVTMQENGRLVLPAALRKELGLKRGEKHTLVLNARNGRGTITPVELHVRELQAKLKHLRPAAGELLLSEQLIAERRAEARREDRGEPRS